MAITWQSHGKQLTCQSRTRQVPEATYQLVRWCRERRIVVIAYNSLGGKRNQARGKAVAEIARRHRVSNAQ
eukprot:1369961-Prymnesium_polylepis.1